MRNGIAIALQQRSVGSSFKKDGGILSRVAAAYCASQSCLSFPVANTVLPVILP